MRLSTAGMFLSSSPPPSDVEDKKEDFVDHEIIFRGFLLPTVNGSSRHGETTAMGFRAPPGREEGTKADRKNRQEPGENRVVATTVVDTTTAMNLLWFCRAMVLNGLLVQCVESSECGVSKRQYSS